MRILAPFLDKTPATANRIESGWSSLVLSAHRSNFAQFFAAKHVIFIAGV
jgi:hypothetical protein